MWSIYRVYYVSCSWVSAGILLAHLRQVLHRKRNSVSPHLSLLSGDGFPSPASLFGLLFFFCALSMNLSIYCFLFPECAPKHTEYSRRRLSWSTHPLIDGHLAMSIPPQTLKKASKLPELERRRQLILHAFPCCANAEVLP